MRKLIFTVFITMIVLTSCGEKSKKKRNLDETLYKYAALIRWANFDAATTLLKQKDEDKFTDFELQKLKQFKVSRYSESPIQPGNEKNIILQNVEITLYNIHTNKAKVIYDHQSWEFDEELGQWFLTSGLPKL